jgi:hypothetical protein
MERMASESFREGNLPLQLKQNNTVGNHRYAEIKIETKLGI